MVDAPKDASERVGALNPGRHHRAAPLFSYIGQALRRGEFFAGLFILGFSNGIFEQIMQAIAQSTIESAILGTFGINRGGAGIIALHARPHRFPCGSSHPWRFSSGLLPLAGRPGRGWRRTLLRAADSAPFRRRRRTRGADVPAERAAHRFVSTQARPAIKHDPATG
jgi:hypothetical protein